MYHVMKPQICESTHHTCNFHKRHPGRPFPGCTCSASYTTRDKRDDEMTREEWEHYWAALRGETPDGKSLF